MISKTIMIEGLAISRFHCRLMPACLPLIDGTPLCFIQALNLITCTCHAINLVLHPSKEFHNYSSSFCWWSFSSVGWRRWDNPFTDPTDMHACTCKKPHERESVKGLQDGLADLSERSKCTILWIQDSAFECSDTRY